MIYFNQFQAWCAVLVDIKILKDRLARLEDAEDRKNSLPSFREKKYLASKNKNDPQSGPC